MARRLLSHLLISLAVFILTATFFMWTIDGRVLNSEVLSAELRKAGVSQELSNLVPQLVRAEGDSSSVEKAEMIRKISQALTAEYIDKKVMEISSSVLTFIRVGEPQPVIDLSDFSDRLRTIGVETGEGGDIEKEFAEPIQLNKDGKLDNLNKAYEIFNMVKFAGLALFAALMLLEWYVAERGQKLKRVSRVFLYSGISYFIYWLALIFAPSQLAPVLQKNVKAEFDPAGIIDAVLKAVQGLFSSYFLSFALGCFAIATTLYIIRHYKHGDVLPGTTPASKSSSPRKK